MAVVSVAARASRRGGGATAARESEVPFRSTSRWLRGRILDVLRDAPADAWARLDTPLGDHDAPALEVALAGLAREGLAERHPSDPRMARLPLG
jgi:hypothetical protein